LWRQKWKQLGTGDEGEAARLQDVASSFCGHEPNFGPCIFWQVSQQWKKTSKVLKRNPQQMKQRKADAVSSKAIFPYSGQPPPGWKLGNGMAF